MFSRGRGISLPASHQGCQWTTKGKFPHNRKLMVGRLAAAMVHLLTALCLATTLPVVSAQWSYSGPPAGCTDVLDTYTGGTRGDTTSGSSRIITVSAAHFTLRTDPAVVATPPCIIRGDFTITFAVGDMRAAAVVASVPNVSITIGHGVQFEGMQDTTSAGALLQWPLRLPRVVVDFATSSFDADTSLPVDVRIGEGVTWTLSDVAFSTTVTANPDGWYLVTLRSGDKVPRGSRIALTNTSATIGGPDITSNDIVTFTVAMLYQPDNQPLVLLDRSSLVLDGATLQLRNARTTKLGFALFLYYRYKYSSLTLLEDTASVVIGGDSAVTAVNSTNGGNLNLYLFYGDLYSALTLRGASRVTIGGSSGGASVSTFECACGYMNLYLLHNDNNSPADLYDSARLVIGSSDVIGSRSAVSVTAANSTSTFTYLHLFVIYCDRTSLLTLRGSSQLAMGGSTSDGSASFAGAPRVRVGVAHVSSNHLFIALLYGNGNSPVTLKDSAQLVVVRGGAGGIAAEGGFLAAVSIFHCRVQNQLLAAAVALGSDKFTLKDDARIRLDGLTVAANSAIVATTATNAAPPLRLLVFGILAGSISEADLSNRGRITVTRCVANLTDSSAYTAGEPLASVLSFPTTTLRDSSTVRVCASSAMASDTTVSGTAHAGPFADPSFVGIRFGTIAIIGQCNDTAVNTAASGPCGVAVASALRTCTGLRTRTRTLAATKTFTDLSRSRSVFPTPTPTTKTDTRTAVVTVSASIAATTTTSPKSTGTRSFFATPTATATASATYRVTGTQTGNASTSASTGATTSVNDTRTATVTPSNSTSFAATPARVKTASVVATATATLTARTSTPSETATLTLSASPSVNDTRTATLTPSNSTSFAATPARVKTASVVATATATLTARTSTPSETATLTLSATAASTASATVASTERSLTSTAVTTRSTTVTDSSPSTSATFRPSSTVSQIRTATRLIPFRPEEGGNDGSSGNGTHKPPPLVPPTEAEPVVGTSQTVTGAVGSIGVVSTVAAVISTSAALQRIAQCIDDDDDNDPLPMLVHPLQFPVGAGPLRYLRGAIVGNTIVIPLAAALLFGVLLPLGLLLVVRLRRRLAFAALRKQHPHTAAIDALEGQALSVREMALVVVLTLRHPPAPAASPASSAAATSSSHPPHGVAHCEQRERTTTASSASAVFSSTSSSSVPSADFRAAAHHVSSPERSRQWLWAQQMLRELRAEMGWPSVMVLPQVAMAEGTAYAVTRLLLAMDDSYTGNDNAAGAVVPALVGLGALAAVLLWWARALLRVVPTQDVRLVAASRIGVAIERFGRRLRHGWRRRLPPVLVRCLFTSPHPPATDGSDDDNSINHRRHLAGTTTTTMTLADMDAAADAGYSDINSNDGAIEMLPPHRSDDEGDDNEATFSSAVTDDRGVEDSADVAMEIEMDVELGAAATEHHSEVAHGHEEYLHLEYLDPPVGHHHTSRQLPSDDGSDASTSSSSRPQRLRGRSGSALVVERSWLWMLLVPAFEFRVLATDRLQCPLSPSRGFTPAPALGEAKGTAEALLLDGDGPNTLVLTEGAGTCGPPLVAPLLHEGQRDEDTQDGVHSNASSQDVTPLATPLTLPTVDATLLSTARDLFRAELETCHEHMIGGKALRWAEIGGHFCALGVGVAEGLPAVPIALCRARVSVAFALIIIQTLLALTTLMPLENFVVVALASASFVTASAALMTVFGAASADRELLRQAGKAVGGLALLALSVALMRPVTSARRMLRAADALIDEELSALTALFEEPPDNDGDDAELRMRRPSPANTHDDSEDNVIGVMMASRSSRSSSNARCATREQSAGDEDTSDVKIHTDKRKHKKRTMTVYGMMQGSGEDATPILLSPPAPPLPAADGDITDSAMNGTGATAGSPVEASTAAAYPKSTGNKKRCIGVHINRSAFQQPQPGSSEDLFAVSADDAGTSIVNAPTQQQAALVDSDIDLDRALDSSSDEPQSLVVSIGINKKDEQQPPPPRKITHRHRLGPDNEPRATPTPTPAGGERAREWSSAATRDLLDALEADDEARLQHQFLLHQHPLTPPTQPTTAAATLLLHSIIAHNDDISPLPPPLDDDADLQAILDTVL